MRRISAILLLALISLSLLTPAFASGTGNTVPACCRRNGKHHCSTVSPRDGAGPALQAVRCAQYPQFGYAVRTGSAAPVASIAVSAVAEHEDPIASLGGDASRYGRRIDANSKRGPPLV